MSDLAQWFFVKVMANELEQRFRSQIKYARLGGYNADEVTPIADMILAMETVVDDADEKIKALAPADKTLYFLLHASALSLETSLARLRQELDRLNYDLPDGFSDEVYAYNRFCDDLGLATNYQMKKDKQS